MSPPESPEEQPVHVHVVPHTHWDREWYWSSGKSRQRLAALIDALFALPPQQAYPFLLDGQAITVVDYLRVRPERSDTLAAAVRRGSLEVGPWYVLADNLIPGGEAIVRNLQAGRRVLARMKADAPAVAWCPDSFGHPAAMPLIAHGFGLNTAVVWRGYGGTGFPEGDSFLWRWNDDFAVAAWQLPPDGYEYGRVLPVDPTEAEKRWRAISAELLSRSTCGVVMLPNGADHHALQPEVNAAIAALKLAATGQGATGGAADGEGSKSVAGGAPPDHTAVITRSSLRDFAADFELAARKRLSIGALPIVRGELRNSYGYTWTLGGTTGTRAQDKRKNAELERLLVHDVEPLCALVLLQRHGEHNTHPGSVGPTLLPSLIAHAWETLLETHPHDTLCGCSIDDVAFDMRSRQRDVFNQTVAVREDALALLLKCDVVAARDGDAVRSGASVVIRNRAARERSGVARIRIVETLDDVPGGPGSGALASASGVPANAVSKAAGGARYASFMTHSHASAAYSRRESPQHYPDDDLVTVTDTLAYVRGIPAMGIAVVDPQLLAADTVPNPVRMEQLAPEVGVEETGRHITNGLIAVDVTASGITLQLGSRTIHNAVWIETQCDLGDTYTTSLRGVARRLTIRSIREELCSDLRSAVTLEMVTEASDGSVDITVDLTIAIEADKPYVLLDVAGVNRRTNHRLRIGIATGIATPVVRADAAFGPVQRLAMPNDTPASTTEAQYAQSQVSEIPPATMPLHRWVSACSGDGGVAVISDGLAECEVNCDGIHVTLVRAIGELSRNDLPERPGHAGWPAPVPDAQSQGNFGAQLAVLAHGGWSDAVLSEIEVAADDVLLPLAGESFRLAPVAPGRIEGVALSGTALRMQALLPAQDGDGVIMRIVNLSESVQRGKMEIPYALRGYSVAGRYSAEAPGALPEDPAVGATDSFKRSVLEWRVVRLDETPLTAPDAALTAHSRLGHEWCPAQLVTDVELSPRAVLTVQLRLRQ